MNAVQFGALATINQRKMMKHAEAQAFNHIFNDRTFGQLLTGADQTFRVWLDRELHDGIEFSIEKSTERSNTPHDQGLRLNFTLNKDLHFSEVIPQTEIEKCDAGAAQQGITTFSNEPQNDITLLTWALVLKTKLLCLNAALVDVFGWDHVSSALQNGSFKAFYDKLGALQKETITPKREKPKLQELV